MIYDRFFDPSVVIWRACQFASPVHCIGEESRAEHLLEAEESLPQQKKKGLLFFFFPLQDSKIPIK